MRVAPGVLAGIVVASTLARAQPAPDVERAKDLYKSAEAAMGEARYDDAIRDYGAAYEITKDPAFFYKIGSANERAGKCDVAIIYWRRYLKEGKPNDDFGALTATKIRACGGDPSEPAPAPADPAPADPAPAPGPAEPAPAPLPPPAPVAPVPKLGRHKGPWLLVGGSIAFVTVGSVLAYSANAAERDVEDLYVGLQGTPPPFNDTTRRRYQDAIDEGKRYQTLSIAAFGVAGAMAIGAAIWFAVDRGDDTLTVEPSVAPGSASVTTTFRF